MFTEEQSNRIKTSKKEGKKRKRKIKNENKVRYSNK